MATAMPGVTILLPVYNQQQYIGACIESLLSQTFTDFELLIINDGSTDDSARICKGYDDPRIRLLHNDHNRGIIYTLNRGLEQAKAPLIARMDADDLAMPKRLALQHSYMQKHPEIGGVASWIIKIDESGKKLRDVSELINDDPTYVAWRLMYDNPIAHTTMMFPTGLVREMGGYSKKALHTEDYDLWSRIHRVRPIHILPEYLIYYRVHNKSLSHVYRPDQELVASQIAWQNLQHSLGHEVDSRLAQLLYYSNKGYRTYYLPQKLIQDAITLLEELYACNLKNQPNKTVQQAILKETRKLSTQLLFSLTWLQRQRLLLTSRFLRGISSPGFYITLFWNWKVFLKRHLKRPLPPPIPI